MKKILVLGCLFFANANLISQVCFTSGVNYTTGGQPIGIVSGDFNNNWNTLVYVSRKIIEEKKLNSGTNEIDISNKPNGFYFVQVVNKGNCIGSKKLIIEK